MINIFLSASVPLPTVEVDADSPAGRAGLEVGDIIVTWSGKQMITMEDLYAERALLKPGAGVSLVVRRNGAERAVSLKF